MLMLSFACRDGFQCHFVPTKEKNNKTKPTINHNVPSIPELIDKSGVDLGEKPAGAPRPHG